MEKEILKSKLSKGDTVSLQSLSSGIAGDKNFLHRFKIGKSRIEKLGLKVIISKHALKGSKFISNNHQKRAEDLNNAFKNPNIKAIIANIGGFDSHKLVPFLDKKVILANPKPIIGFSDITSLHLFMYSIGIQTYYGPSVLDGFAENVKMHKITKKSIKKILFTNNKQKIKSSSLWTSQFLDWANEKNDFTRRKMNKEKRSHIFINVNKNISGNLIGGCLDTIALIRNKDFFPKLNQWKNKIIFLETSEQKIKPKEFLQAIQSLKKYIKVSQALIFGKPKDEKYFSEYLEIIKKEIKKPVIYNLNFGHTAPFYTIAYGGKISINYKNKKVIISK